MKEIRLVYIACLIVFSLIVLRLFYWQVISRDSLQAKAEKQYLRDIELFPKRGEILASDGSPLVTNQTAYLMYANPKEISDPNSVAEKIQPILDLSDIATVSAELLPEYNPDVYKKEQELKQKERQVALTEKITQTNLDWVLLGRKLTNIQKEQIEKLNINGLGFSDEIARDYPEGSMSAHLLGFVGLDDFGRDTGYFGLEGFYNRQLKGRLGVTKEETDAKGNPILLGDYGQIGENPGRTLKLTIDRSVQKVVEEELLSSIESYQAKAGQVLIMDPTTGAIIASAAYPAYDPANYTKYPNANYVNPVVAETYEPGSTFKVLAMAAGINENVIQPETICTICDGQVEISGYKISTWDNKYHPNSTMTEVIQNSDNTGMVFLSQKLGFEKFHQYLKNFGFGDLTGVDIQDETYGVIRPKKDWGEIDLATASFGQGIAVTSIQMVKAVSAIANGGKLPTPHFVSEIIDGDNPLKVSPDSNSFKSIITKETAGKVTEMMAKAVVGGEAHYKIPDGYSLAGKTGTAQIPVAGHYDPSKTIASFVGFGPLPNPKFVMLVRFTEPKSSPYGSETAAPTFFRISSEIFRLWSIPPNL